MLTALSILRRTVKELREPVGDRRQQERAGAGAGSRQQQKAHPRQAVVAYLPQEQLPAQADNSGGPRPDAQQHQLPARASSPAQPPALSLPTDCCSAEGAAAACLPTLPAAPFEAPAQQLSGPPASQQGQLAGPGESGGGIAAADSPCAPPLTQQQQLLQQQEPDAHQLAGETGGAIAATSPPCAPLLMQQQHQQQPDAEQLERAERNRQAALQRRALRQLQDPGQQQLTAQQRYAMQQRERERQDLPPPRILVHASEVAALAGLDRRRPREEAILRLWRRAHPASFARSAAGARLAKAERLADAICAAAPAAHSSEAAVRLAEAAAACVPLLPPPTAPTGTPAAAQQAGAGEAAPVAVAPPTAAAAEALEEAVMEAREVRRCVKARVYQSFGRAREDTVFEALQGQGLPDLVRDRRLYRAAMDGGSWSLRGRIDGKVDNEGGLLVVEIKNRVRQLYGRARLHERVQVETYMRLLGAQRAALAECYTAAGGGMQVLVHWVGRDDELWEQRVLPGLRGAVGEVRARIAGGGG